MTVLSLLRVPMEYLVPMEVRLKSDVNQTKRPI